MKYKIEAWDLMHDIWILKKRVLWIFWRIVGTGSKCEVQKKMDELNTE